MIQAMQGVLADEPELSDLRGPDGRQFTLAKANLYYWDGRKGSEDVIIRLLAWNEQAQHLARYHKGDELQFIGRLNASLSPDLLQTTLTFTVQKIDDSRTLISAVEEFLRNFTPPKERLSEMISSAEKRKAAENTQSFEQQEKDIYT